MSVSTESFQQVQRDLQEARQRIRDLERRLEQAECLPSIALDRHLLESIPGALFILAPGHRMDAIRVLAVNESTCRILGYSREELLNMTMADIDARPSEALPPDVIERLLAGQLVILERVHRCKDGSLVPVEVHSRLANLNGRDVVISLTHDISLRKAMEEDLRMFEAAIRQAEDAVIITDAPHDRRPDVIFANQAFTKITGYTLQEAIEADISVLQLPGTVRTQDAELSLLHAATQRREIFQGKTHSYRKDRTPITLHWSITPVVDAEGTPRNFVAVVRDVTKQEQQIQQLQEMTNEIQAQRDHLNAILDSMQDALMSISLLDRSMIHVSASFEEVFGYPVGQFMNEPEFFKKIVHPDDLDLAMQMRSQALTEGYADFEHRILLPNGQVRWLHRRAWVNFDGSGRPIRVNDSARDITRQKQAEDAWKASQELYRRQNEILHQAHDLIALSDLGGYITYINQAGADLLGVGSVSEIIGRRVDEFHDETEARYIFEECIPYAIEHGQWRGETRMRNIQGAVISVDQTIFPIREADGEIRLMATIIVDIRKRKEAEESIRQSEMYLRSLVESQTAFTVRVNQHGHLSYCNRRYTEQFGGAAPSLIGLSSLAMIHPADQQKVFEATAICMQNAGRPVQLEIRKRIPDGGYIWTMWEFLGIQDRNGDVTEIQCMGFDTTRQKQAEAELQIMNTRLEQRVLERTAELRATKDRLEAIFDHSADGILLLHVEHGLQQSNVAFDRMFQVSAGGCVGSKLSERFGEDDAAILDAVVAEVSATKQTRRIEASARRADGAIFDVEISLAPVNPAEEQVVNLVGIIRDITERRQAQQAIAEERNLLKTVINAVPDYIYVKDREYRMILNNLAHLRSMGYENQEDVLGKTDFDLFSPEDAALFHASDVELFRTGQQVRNRERTSKNRDGTSKWESTNKVPLYSLSNEIIGLVGITYDTTPIKAKEEALRESEARYRTLITSMSEGIVLQGQDGAIRTCNEAAAQILGLTEDQLLGRTSLDPRWRAIHKDGSVFSGETHPAMVALHTGAPQSNIVMGIHKPNGSLTWVSINARPVFKAGETRPDAVVVTFTDISQQIEVEKALERALAHEKELGELKSRFVSMTSHEFRTPLTAILATTETLTIYRKRMDEAQIDERLDRIRRQVLHMKGLMEDILQLARIQAGRVPFNPEVSPLDELCAELIEEAEIHEPRPGRIIFTCPQRPLMAYVDTQLMRQIISNILSNALKYSPKEKPVYVSILPSEGQILLTVEDQGIGIPNADQEHLFEPFHRGQNVGATSGTGLGLSIARQSLELHQGTLQVSSTEGKGTTITVTLPNPVLPSPIRRENAE